MHPNGNARILTTHAGSLPRPPVLIDRLHERDQGRCTDPEPLRRRVRVAVADVVSRQLAAGIDVVGDGEQSKSSYLNYVTGRVAGFEHTGDTGPFDRLDDRDFPEFAQAHHTERWPRPSCTGPVSYRDPGPVRADIDALRSAIGSEEPADAFLTAASPGVVAMFVRDRYYAGEEAFVFALADALKEEYDEIHKAGLMLQLDCPDLAGGRSGAYADRSDAEFRAVLRLHVEALNHAVRDIPPERMRMHVCWGNYLGPHHCDVELAAIIDILLEARPAGLSVEGANPRHGHEWRVFEDVKLPEGKVLIPGTIDSTTNFVEHHDLVAQRVVQYASLVGRDNIIAGTDCGFGTMAKINPQVDPRIAWAKLASLAEGTRQASKALW